jgi:thioredoxin-related protein
MAKLLVVALLLTLSGWVHAETRDVDQYFFDQKLGDFKAELATAKQEGKQGILLMFEMEECPFCHRMKTTILNQSEVQDYYRQHFLIFSVDIKGDTTMVDFKGKDTTEKQFAIENRVRATPVFAFFDLDGNQMTRFTGAANDVNEFLQLGHYAAEGAYKDVSFSKFKQQSRQ